MVGGVLDDLQLIWDNCKLYNAAGSVRFESHSGFTVRRTRWRSILGSWSRTILQGSICLVLVLFELLR